MPPSTLFEYPIGEALGFRDNGDAPLTGTQPALYPPSDSVFAKLATKPLDPYLKRVVPEVLTCYEKMSKKTIKMAMVELLSPVKIQVTGKHVGEELIIIDNAEDGQTIVQAKFRVLPTATAEHHRERHISQPSTANSPDNIQQALITFDVVLLFNSLLLDNVKFRLDNTKDIKEKNIRKLEQLKIGLIQYTKCIDRILLHYSHFPLLHCVELPDPSKINNCKEEIMKIVDQMNPEDLQSILSGSVVNFPEAILCSIIGLGSDYALCLRKLPKGIKHHQSKQYFLKEFIKNRFEALENVDSFDLEKGIICRALLQVGFTEYRAELIAEWICQLPDDVRSHQPLWYWIDVYLDDLFQNDILLNTDACARFPYNEDVVNKWSSVNIDTRYTDNGSDREEDDDDVVDQSNESNSVRIMNTTNDKAKTLTRDGVAYPPKDNPELVWFHGTDHQSAKHILENGINIGKGRGKMDFSDGDGFYVTSSYAYALDWAKGRGSDGAVLVFKIPSDLLSSFDGMDFFGNEGENSHKDWSLIVKYNRCGRTRGICKLPKLLEKEFRKSHYVYGPMSTDGMMANKPNWQPSGFGRKERVQLCIRKDELANEFGKLKNIDGTIFLSKD